MGEVDGAEGPGSFNKLNQLVVTSHQPLRPEGTGQGGAKCEWGTVGIEVKDGRGIEGDRGRGGGERRRKPCGSEGRGERKRRT